MSDDANGSDPPQVRREGRRFPLNADVEVLEPVSAHGVVINVSEGGMRVAIDRELQVDAMCVLEVQLEQGKTIELARVAWVREHPDGFLVGLSLVNEEPEQVQQ
ncbi:MAG: PilZ domain-containing protein [Myxococcales bacterium]|nr:PilZ domain-containing protein [Myxococcales bacterium]